jgi:sensor c-di-GMP phosphodiesterase-like protein
VEDNRGVQAYLFFQWVCMSSTGRGLRRGITKIFLSSLPAQDRPLRKILSDFKNYTDYAFRRDDMICTTITMAMPTNIAATTAYAAAAHPPIFGPSAVRLTPAATLATMQKRTATTVMKLGSFVDFTFSPPAGKCLKTDHFTTKGELISKKKWFRHDGDDSIRAAAGHLILMWIGGI